MIRKKYWSERALSMANSIEDLFKEYEGPPSYFLGSAVNTICSKLRIVARAWDRDHPLVVCPGCNGDKIVPHDHLFYKCDPKSCMGSKCYLCDGTGEVRRCA